MQKAMTQFALRWNGSYPASIVFFRDGVSEGEYEIVSNNEIAKIKGEAAAAIAGLQVNGIRLQRSCRIWSRSTRTAILSLGRKRTSRMRSPRSCSLWLGRGKSRPVCAFPDNP